MGPARRPAFRRLAGRASARGLGRQRSVLALRRAPALLPGLLVHNELRLVDIAAVAVVNRGPARVLDVAKPFGDAPRRHVVGADVDSSATQVEIVEEVAMERQGRVEAIPLAPLVRSDDELI